MLECLYSNPWRTPTWRWRRAEGIFAGQQPGTTPKRDGEEGYYWIRKAVKFLDAQQQCTDDNSRMTLALLEPAIFWASYIFSQGDQPARWAIEARIMARELDRNIAFHHDCGVEVIQAYEALFFNVREKLERRDYIVNSVFGEAVQRGLTERQYDLLWKLFAYSLGPCALEAMMDRIVAPVWVNRPEEVTTALQSTAVNAMKKKAAVAALTVPINNATQIHLIEAFVKYVEVERTTDMAGKGNDQILAHLHGMLTTLPFSVAKLGTDATGPLAAYDKSAIELDSDELILAAAGVQLHNKELLMQLKFPEPPKEPEEKAAT